MAFGRGWYFCRYGIGSALGIILCVCLVLARRQLRSPSFIAGLILAAGFQYLHEFEGVVRVSTDLLPANKLIETESSDFPIVISNPFTYPTIWWYSPAVKKPEVVYLDRPLGDKYHMVSVTLTTEKPFIQAPLMDFKSFTARIAISYWNSNKLT